MTQRVSADTRAAEKQNWEYVLANSRFIARREAAALILNLLADLDDADKRVAELDDELNCQQMRDTNSAEIINEIKSRLSELEAENANTRGWIEAYKMELSLKNSEIATLESQLADARSAALEEAAKVAEKTNGGPVSHSIAAAIRALKPKGPQG